MYRFQFFLQQSGSVIHYSCTAVPWKSCSNRILIVRGLLSYFLKKDCFPLILQLSDPRIQKSQWPLNSSKNLELSISFQHLMVFLPLPPPRKSVTVILFCSTPPRRKYPCPIAPSFVVGFFSYTAPPQIPLLNWLDLVSQKKKVSKEWERAQKSCSACIHTLLCSNYSLSNSSEELELSLG